MRYMLQVYFNGADERLRQLPEAEREAIVQEYEAFFQLPQVKDGNQLQPPATATTIRVHEGEIAHSTGPFTPDEPLGGYYVVEVSGVDAAVAIAAHIPAARMGAAVEVRPLVER
ncbi:YciI family protein [Micromonospora sp. CPCC 205371]|nr:YciI family protein [Micromonospora sp. CPCC 205371]